VKRYSVKPREIFSDPEQTIVRIRTLNEEEKVTDQKNYEDRKRRRRGI
jgi:hypothetical protein